MSDLLIEDKTGYLFTDREFFERLEKYQPNLADYYEPVRRSLPADWTLESRGFWWDCMPPSPDMPAQGWKIHISATPAHAPGIVTTVARILFARDVAFKFVVDRQMLMSSNSKRWHRGGAGKFITIYPRSTEECGDLLEVLHKATTGYSGPYILSDRRYSTSKIVHYRYGGMMPVRRVDVTGKAVYVIQDNDGNYIDDERRPYFSLPPKIEDPFEHFAPKSLADEKAEPGTLKDGRYKIDRLIAVSNSGGVYLATDRDNEDRQVIIKEARPYTNTSTRGLDAPQLLKKEERLLRLLSGTGIAPEAYDFFIDWEHSYLVEEYLSGSTTMRSTMIRMNLLLETNPTQEHSVNFYRRYRAMYSRLAYIVKTLHDRSIVFSDLSMENVLVFEQEGEMVDMKLIDFEGAYEEGVDLPTHLFTPGFSPEEVMDRGSSERRDDYYSLGGLMMAGLFPMNSLLMVNRNAHEKYLRACEHDFDLPRSISDVIRALLDTDPQKRPPPEKVIEVLAETHTPRAPSVSSRELDEVDIESVIERSLDYIDSVADYNRRDRLYPADPIVFESNPLSIAYGACGVAYVINKLRGRVDPRTMDWIISHQIKGNSMPTGLYVGLSGIAWSLLEMGHLDKARATLAMTDEHPLLYRSPNLFNGTAGWGMTQLRFFAETGDPSYLDAARRAGEHLIETRQIATTAEGRCYWDSPDGISASFAYGAAGISLFLLYLHLATKDARYFEVGTEGLEWVISESLESPHGGRSWLARKGSRTFTPYWSWGSSGIGRVLLRYWHITGESRYRYLLGETHLDTDHKFTIFPGYFFGTAGICEMYMDMARFPEWEELAMKTTRKLLAGCMLFATDRPGGIAFPGDSLLRISCDLGTGGAGVALMMHRYHTRCGASFMLDNLISGWPLEDKPA